MTRRIYYANMLANSLFQMQDQVESMIELSQVIQSVLGDGIVDSPTNNLPLFTGFAATPTDPASLSVNVAGGAVYSWEDVDDIAFGSAPSQIAPNSNQIAKLAYSFTPTVLTFVPPVTPGNSRNDLICIGFVEADGSNQSIPFWGGVTNITVGTQIIPVPNPPVFQNENMQRIDSPTVTVQSGTPAATGTQTTPTPPAGTAGSYVVTTTQGQTTIISGNITAYQNAGFSGLISETLTMKISEATANGLYAPLDGATFSGAMTPFGGPKVNVPSGWLYCDGSAINRLTYPSLFAAITYLQTGATTNTSPIVTGLSDTSEMFVGMNVTGAGIPINTSILTVNSATQITLNANATASASVAIRFYLHGDGDGSTTFNLPNPPGRTIVGGGAGAGLTACIAGQTGGAETVSLTAANNGQHNHTGSTADPHRHNQNNTGLGFDINNTGGTNTVLNVEANLSIGYPTYTADVNTLTIADDGLGTPFSILDPRLVLNYIIKT